MTEDVRSIGIATFAAFEFDPATGELRKEGTRVRLQEQPARILTVLLRSAGRVVTREELRDMLWSADTFVDFDHGLNTAVRKIRSALDDSAEAPRFIETLAKRGYRFLSPVEWTTAGAPPEPPAPARPLAPETARRATPRALLLWSTLAGVVAATAFVGWKWLRPATVAEQPPRTIAVLPVENRDPGTAYLSDGIAEGIIDGLSKSTGVRVTARTSSFRYRDTPADLRAIGRQLNVAAILTGRFEGRGDECVLRLELVDTKDGAQIWSKEYRQQLSALETLRARVVNDLALRLGVSGRDVAGIVRNAEAYDLYLRGRYLWNQRTLDDQLRAVESFRRATELDPRFAPAWAGLANVYGTLVGNSLVPGQELEVQLKSIASAKRAIELDSTNADAYASLAASKLNYYRDYSGAERDFRKAIDLNPSNPNAHLWYAHLLAKTGRMDEAVREGELGWRLDPYSRPGNMGRCFLRIYARQYDAALDIAREAEARDSEATLTRCAVWASLLKGDVRTAVDQLSETAPDMRAALETLGPEPDRAEFLRRVLPSLPETRNYDRAAIYAMLGERDTAFAELERAWTTSGAYVGFIWVDPRFDNVRDDPRLLDLALRLKLPQAKAVAARGERGSTPVPGAVRTQPRQPGA